jgi:hypothetical protein
LDLVRVWHPDRFESDPALQARAAKRLAEINEAYDFLRDVHTSRQNPNNSRPRSTPKASPTPQPSNTEPPPPHSSKDAGARQPRPEPPPRPIPDAEQNARRLTFGVIAALALFVVFGLFLGPQESVAPSSDVGVPDAVIPAATATAKLAEPGSQGQFRMADAPPIGADVTALVEKYGGVVEPPAAPAPPFDPFKPFRIAARAPAVAVYSQTVPGVERPDSGVELIGGSDTGLGTLNVRNGTSRDAVVVVYQGDLQRRAVYIWAGSAAAIPKVAAGSYTARFTSGAWWNGEEFLKETTFLEFERPLVFAEKPETDGIAYSDFDLTLQRIVGGNARTRSTAPFKLSKQVPLEGR